MQLLTLSLFVYSSANMKEIIEASEKCKLKLNESEEKKMKIHAHLTLFSLYFRLISLSFSFVRIFFVLV